MTPQEFKRVRHAGLALLRRRLHGDNAVQVAAQHSFKALGTLTEAQ